MSLEAKIKETRHIEFLCLINKMYLELQILTHFLNCVSFFIFSVEKMFSHPLFKRFYIIFWDHRPQQHLGGIINNIHNANPKEYFPWHSISKIILFIE